MFGLPGWVASSDIMKSSFFLSHCCTCHKENLLGYMLAPPSSFSGTIPSLRPPARELLGNQNQLLVLSPLSPFWLCINCGVVFSESSLWTRRPPPWLWHHHAMENVPHFLLFLQFYCSTDSWAGAGTFVPCISRFEQFRSISSPLARKEGGRDEKWDVRGKEKVNSVLKEVTCYLECCKWHQRLEASLLCRWGC